MGGRVYAFVRSEGSEIEGTAPLLERHEGFSKPMPLLHDPTRSKETAFWSHKENTDALDVHIVELLQRLPHFELRGRRRDAERVRPRRLQPFRFLGEHRADDDACEIHIISRTLLLPS